jgi:beta-lactamase class A
LEARIAPLAKAHKGKVAVAVKNLETGESYYLNADEEMPTASLIKVAVLMEAYQQADEGKLKLTDPVTLRDADKVPGSGVLTDHFSDGATFPLRDAVHLMIVFSDNTATNLVLDKVGLVAVNKRMDAWGCPHTKITGKVFREKETSVDPERTKRFDLGVTTAREMASLLEELQAGARFRPGPKQAILNHLKMTVKKPRLPRLLPPDVVVAHKGGSFEDARTDAAVIYTTPGPVVVCVLTCENDDRRNIPDNDANLLCAHIGREVYDYFTEAGRAPKPSPK